MTNDTNPITSADLFLQGQRDCQQGTPAKRNMGPDYDRGYTAQYFQEQALTQLSLQRGVRRGSY